MAGKKKGEVHKTRARVLQYVHEYIGEFGTNPTIRAIMRELGMKSTSNVKYHLDHLAKNGDLEIFGTGNWRRILIPGAVVTLPDLPEWARAALNGETADD